MNKHIKIFSKIVSYFAYYTEHSIAKLHPLGLQIDFFLPLTIQHTLNREGLVSRHNI